MIAKNYSQRPSAVADVRVASLSSDRAMRAVAAVLRSSAYAISATMLARAVRKPERTIGLELIALGFVERFADAVDCGDASAVVAWVVRTCARQGDATIVARLLAAGQIAICEAIHDMTPSLDRRIAFPLLNETLESIVAQPRRALDGTDDDTLDEVDVVLGELIERLELADPGTADHSRAVAQWCARIGKRLGLPSDQTVHMMRCGLIHDIGKMSTPPDILRAPRRLSTTETNVMRRHAEDGAAMVGTIAILAHLRPAVRWHHERLDGRGYPDGLRGDAIPIAARIVSVADSFNAMIATRPYRSPMRPATAIEELWRHAGTQFDADIISAMCAIVMKRA